MQPYPLRLRAIYVSPLFWFLHYSDPRNLFAQTLKPELSAAISVFFSLYQAAETTCDREKFIGAPVIHVEKKTV